jgi:hypothetical protein
MAPGEQALHLFVVDAGEVFLVSDIQPNPRYRHLAVWLTWTPSAA